MVHNRASKSVAVIEIETVRIETTNKAARTFKVLRHTAIRGYDKDNRRVKKLLRQLPGISAVDVSELDSRIVDLGIDVNAYDNKPRYKLDPRSRADDTAKHVLKSFADNMQLNTPGVVADIDSECLHDFRIAVRRTRTLLAQLPEIFPAQRRQRA